MKMCGRDGRRGWPVGSCVICLRERWAGGTAPAAQAVLYVGGVCRTNRMSAGFMCSGRDPGDNETVAVVLAKAAIIIVFGLGYDLNLNPRQKLCSANPISHSERSAITSPR